MKCEELHDASVIHFQLDISSLLFLSFLYVLYGANVIWGNIYVVNIWVLVSYSHHTQEVKLG